MPSYKKTRFDGKILVIGCGPVSQCTLPLLARHLDMPLDRITIIDFVDQEEKISEILNAGAKFEQKKISKENIADVLKKQVGPGDLIVDLAWNIDTLTIVRWCYENEVKYINTSVENGTHPKILNVSPPMKEVWISVKCNSGN